ncbi:MAG: histidine kinase [Deltaproteobacteria bacterium]|nr:MAG: histidine kinase [Deltaproteobacteria bacterium]
MRHKNPSEHKIDFVVGTELSIGDLLMREETMPVLLAIVRGGAFGAGIVDSTGTVLCAAGDAASLGPPACAAGQGMLVHTRPILHEGEPVGMLVVTAPQSYDPAFLAAVTDIAYAALALIVRNTAKRMLTTELHTTVVQQSYAELIERNQQLQASEARYRDLAAQLEKKVEERTGQLDRAHARLFQQEKMASIGQLAAGVAHEINNPLGFISSNLNTLEGYSGRLLEMIGLCREMIDRHDIDRKKIEEQSRRLKIDFIVDDVPALFVQSKDGIARVKKIVADLKGFSHIDESRESFVSLNDELEKTISVLSHESGDRILYIKDYGVLPQLLCKPALLSQVFFNIILNAIQATDGKIELQLSTRAEQDEIVVVIQDNGPGIPASVINRVFEPFFTTKEVGKATGLGLSVAYDIVKQHRGDIMIESMMGKGSIVTVRLPVRRGTDV